MLCRYQALVSAHWNTGNGSVNCCELDTRTRSKRRASKETGSHPHHHSHIRSAQSPLQADSVFSLSDEFIHTFRCLTLTGSYLLEPAVEGGSAGTTGLPKGVVYTDELWLTNMASYPGALDVGFSYMPLAFITDR